MTYKDEYEVARLHGSAAASAALDAQFEGNYKLKFNLAPPLVARKDPSTGRPRKMEVGAWMLPVFRLLQFEFDDAAARAGIAPHESDRAGVEGSRKAF